MQEAINFDEYRGLRSLVIAKLLTDTEIGLTYETPVKFAGVQEVGAETEESSGTKYYDNKPAIVNVAEGADTYALTTSVLRDKVKALVEGRVYDDVNKMFLGTPLDRPYCAIGFVGEKTDGTEEYVWVYKGKFTGGASNYKTKDDSTDSNGQSWNFSSVYTNKTFAKANNNPLKYTKIAAGGKIAEAAFFAKVWTPDDLTA